MNLSFTDCVTSVLFYYAYRADEVPDSPAYRIAVGCAAAEGGANNRIDRHNNGRCSFEKFLRYLVATPGNPAPQITNILPPGTDIEDLSINRVYNNVEQIRVEKTAGDSTSKIPIKKINVPGDRLIQGATSWYDALAQIGRSFTLAQPKLDKLQMDISKLPPEEDETKDQEQVRKALEKEQKPLQKVVEQGKLSAQYAHDLRRKDYDKFFRDWVNKDTSFKDIIKTRPGRNAVPALYVKWERNDLGATIRDAANQEKIPDISNRILDKLRQYRSSTDANIQSHIAAMDSHIRSLEGAGCTSG